MKCVFQKSLLNDTNHIPHLYSCTYICNNVLRKFDCLFACLGFFVPLENFHSYGDVTITGEGLQILTYARHLWPSSSEGSLPCHTLYDKGHPFIMVISEDPSHSHLLLIVWQCSCHYLFLRLRSVVAGIRTPNLPLAGRTLLPTAPPPPRFEERFELLNCRYNNIKFHKNITSSNIETIL